MATAVKVSDDLFDKAKIKSKVFKRSIVGQIEYWAKIGQMIEENPDLPLPFIQDLLRLWPQAGTIQEALVPTHCGGMKM